METMASIHGCMDFASLTAKQFAEYQQHYDFLNEKIFGSPVNLLLRGYTAYEVVMASIAAWSLGLDVESIISDRIEKYGYTDEFDS